MRLLEGVRQNLGLDELAVRHGRSVGAIRVRLARHVPLTDATNPTDATDEDLLRWVRSCLPPGGGAEAPDPDPGYTPTAPAPATPAPGAAGVLADWQQLTGHTLGAERQPVFLARPAVGALAAVDCAVRRDTGRRLWQETQQLLLDDWALECRCPGARTLAPSWNAIAERDDDTAMVLRELLAAAVDEIPGERDRRIVSLRFGVGDHDAQTQEKIADAFGLSRERIRQLQNRAVRAMARAGSPATGRLRALVSELGRLDGSPSGDEGPSSAERLLDLAQVLLPAVAPRQAVTLLAALAGVGKVPADNLAAQAMTIRTLRQDAERREASRQGRVERATARWQRLADRITWFGTPENAPPRGELTALREAEDDDPRSGSWHCPKLGRPVAYESETERHLIQLLSFAPQIAYYQEQPLAIGYEFDGHTRTYFPDLLVATTDGRCVLVEVKALFEMATAVNLAKCRALEQLCRERGWGLLITDGHRTRALLEEHRPDPRLADLIEPLLDDGTVLGWPQVVSAAGGQRPDWMDFAALVLSRGWDWRTRPFRLSAGAAVPGPDATAAVEAGQAMLPQADPTPPPAAPVRPTAEDIEAARTPAGGWRRDQLAAWGVPWPPPKGWKKRLIDQAHSART
ncbi:MULTISPECIES: sigma factor-like helix-turn-helix DNA-binding protein [unclassified Kitasatospora]|uniref:sigma factor-like helix-turn-helix DNA-binding protein n=1 Tax=unclassified Kitasatospora TaxID=2633591 RepID=UPI0033C05C54